MPDVILHQYPQSPVAEKVRVGFGIKNLSWRSVEIPRLPPKPDLVPLTGGYRRTPVMQIGADIYCDSQCILREIERRFPEPAYYSAETAGLGWGLTRWTDAHFFETAIKTVLAGAGDQLPADFAQDRGRLYFGSDWQQALTQARLDLDHLAAQLRGQFQWLDQTLAHRQYLTGDTAGLADAFAYYLVWFIRGRWQPGAELLSEFANLQRWEQAVQAIGHGSYTDLSADDALAIAAASETVTQQHIDPQDAQHLQAGMQVSINPDVDGGEMPVTGKVHAVSCQQISILRSSEQTGEVCVHFPRVGYRIVPQ